MTMMGAPPPKPPPARRPEVGATDDPPSSRLPVPSAPRPPGAPPGPPPSRRGVSGDGDDDEKVAALLEAVEDVCPVPAAAQRVMSLTADVNCDIRKVAEAIAGDPALAAEAMKVANSALYRRGKPIDTLGQAIVTLGLAQVREMSSALAMMAAFSTEQERALNFHTSSVLAGTLAGMLASELRGDAGAAFLAGLLSEVGAMACLAVDPERFAAIYAESNNAWHVRAELERKRYGAPSWRIGQKLLVRNQLPVHICAAVGSQFDDPGATSHSLLERVTQFGRIAAPEVMLLPDGEPIESLAPRMVEIALACGLPNPRPEQMVPLVTRAVASAETKLASVR